MMRWILGFLLLLPGLAVAAPPSADIFTADYSTRAGNWDGVSADTSEVTTTRVAGGGPHGIDALQIQFFAAGDGEEDLGGSETNSNPATGVARYYRYYEWHHASNNFAAQNQDGSSSVVWRLKRMIIGNGGGGNRVIINSNAEAGAVHVEGIIDGSSVGSSGDMSLGAWHAIQIEVIYNSPGSSTIKVWVDNDTYASPTFTVTYAATIPTNSGTVGFGRYSNHRLRTSGDQFIYREAAFSVASTFSSSWNDWRVNGDGSSTTTTGVTGSARITGARIQ